MTTNTPSQAASIADDEFKRLMYAYRWTAISRCDKDNSRAWDKLVAHIDAKLTQAQEDGNIDGMALMCETAKKSLCDEFGVPYIEGEAQTFIMVEAAIKERIEALQVRAECAEECFAKLTASDNEWRDRANLLEARLGEVMEKRDELRDRAEAAEAKLGNWDRIVETSLAQDYATRAIAAESRLAEIQRGVEGLRRYEFRTGFKLNVPAAGMLPTELGPYVMFEDVENLLAPQGQADTSGLPG